jgi:micrococcal nuclease
MRKFLILPLIAAAVAIGFSTAGADRAAAAACSDFPNQAAAQRAANTRDADGDGIYCETLPCPCLGKAGGSSGGSPGVPTAPSRTGRLGQFTRLPVTITSVVDGDTLKIRTDKGVNTTMRVIGIDTPETRKPGVPVECGGKEATAFMTRLAKGKRGVIIADRTQDSVDKYGRALGYIQVGGRDLGLALVRAGWADVYIYRDVPFARTARYQSAQAQAKAQVLGVFASCQGDFHSEQESKGSEHVIGGSWVGQPNPFPFMTALLDRSNPDPFQAQFCGGALVAPSWVLTAGHCISDGLAIRDPSTIDVTMTYSNLGRLPADGRIKVTEIIRHPNYGLVDDGTAANDVALLRLQVALPVAPVALPNAGDTRWTDGSPFATVLGWGRTDPYDPRYYGMELQRADVRVYDRAACWSAYRINLFNSELCAGNWRGVPTVCNGDSGGPLLRQAINGQWVAIGVTAWGPAYCTKIGEPPVFSSTAFFRSWIDGVLRSSPAGAAKGTTAGATISLSNPSARGLAALRPRGVGVRLCSDFPRVLLNLWRYDGTAWRSGPKRVVSMGGRQCVRTTALGFPQGATSGRPTREIDMQAVACRALSGREPRGARCNTTTQAGDQKGFLKLF